MDKNDLERRLEAAEKQNLGLLDEIKNLKAQLAEMQDEPEIPDFPAFHRDEPYWAMDGYMFVYGGEASGVIDDDFNIFHTEKYAQLFADKCKLIAMMLHCKWYLCRDFKGDYSSPDYKWVVYYGGLDNKFIATNSIHCDYGFVTFDTEENAQKCADWLNAHWKEGGNG